MMRCLPQSRAARSAAPVARKQILDPAVFFESCQFAPASAAAPGIGELLVCLTLELC
jgi:hypothetical protein